MGGSDHVRDCVARGSCRAGDDHDHHYDHDNAAVQQTSPPPSAAAYPPDNAPYPIASHWLVSGSIGSDFENDADDPSVNFAGTAGWLYHGVIGGEFQANFTPDFNLNPAIVSAAPFLADEPSINTYMLNLIAAAPLMAGGQFQPYVSGGPGWFKMHGDTIAGRQQYRSGQDGLRVEHRRGPDGVPRPVRCAGGSPLLQGVWQRVRGRGSKRPAFQSRRGRRRSGRVGGTRTFSPASRSGAGNVGVALRW
jgi:hypothetical protein